MIENEYYKNLSKKRIGAGALFFNSKNELLIVKPTYRDHWSIPGGSVDANESPRDACIREIKEELGLNIGVKQFLCVDYRHSETKGESLQFIFYGGVLMDDEIMQIKLPADELSNYRFIEPSEALELVGNGIRLRLPYCFEAIKNEIPAYLENGKL